MIYKFSNLITNPEEHYARAWEGCKIWLANPEYEDLLTSMECSDLSEVTFKGCSIKIVYSACLRDVYSVEIEILLYNLNKSKEMLGHYVLVENEVGEGIDDCIAVY
jgi:hypothetical protein